MSHKKIGILLLNLGTPSAPDPKAVRAYLKEFLSDPFVVDLPWLLRMILLYGVILPIRSKKSSHAYQQIWLEEGSPLLIYSKQFTAALNETLDEHFVAVLGMRYGKPNIAEAVNTLQKWGCQRVLVFPLFPQYSHAATGSVLKAALDALKKYFNEKDISIQRAFYNNSYYLQTVADRLKPTLMTFKPEMILFSYHGLPQRQLTQKDVTQVCYRTQCVATTKSLAERLALTEKHYQTTFQSRLGCTEWIRPYTDEVMQHLAEKGVKRLMVVCPSFVADCLETLEEIGIRLRQQWLAAGGEAFYLAPSLNADPRWVAAFKQMIAEHQSTVWYV
ncbi:MAG: ferrochelatase [Gammaproteobacteria bacterium RIFCSPHIGHO2_12_FULL_41_15]|nr:MAG: ferrochelatase [Gammaproteobacteria bacterium RIFCSPHIGHO2_12_FULL_41_15]